MDITTVGVWDNMIYDIIPVVSEVPNASVAVNAATISVDCSPIPDITQTAFWANESTDGPVYQFTFGEGKYAVNVHPMCM